MLTYSAVLTCDVPGCYRSFRRNSMVLYRLSGVRDARALGWRGKSGEFWYCPEHANQPRS